jgi:hypothetical protein
MNFDILLYSVLFYVLFLFLGFGLTVLFCPKRWLKYTIFLSPIIGYCLLTLAGWYFYNLNFKGTDAYYYWILLIGLIFLIVAVIKIWKQRIITKLFSRELIIPVVIAIIAFLAVASPALRQDKMTSFVLGNTDIASYSLASKIIKELPRDGAYQIINYYSVYEATLGGFLNTAFFSSVAKLDPYQVQMVSLYFFFIVSLLLVYVLGKEIFRYSTFTSNVIISLFGLNSVLYYVIYMGFENQIIAMSLMLLIFLCNVAIIRSDKFTEAICYFPFLFLALWGLSLTYNHMLVIIYALIIAYVLVSYWKNRKVVILSNWAAMNCIAVAIILCLSPQRLQMVISNTFLFSGVTAGWFMSWITLPKLFGITPFLSQDTMVISIIVSFALIVLIVYGFVKLYRRDMENFLFSFTTFLLIIVGALILSFWNIAKNNGGFGGYNQFKLISFFLPLLLLASFALFRNMTFNIHSITREKTLYFVIIAALVIGNCLSAGRMLYSVVKNPQLISPDTIDLQNVRNNEEIESINIPADSGAFWNIMWEAYFLFPKKLFFEQTTYYGATPLNGEWSLVRNTGTEKVLSVLGKPDPNTIQINSTYSLSKSAPQLTARYGIGWSSDEVTHRWTTSDDASVIIDSISENMLINLSLIYAPLNQNNRLSIYLNGNKIQDCGNSTCLINNLLLKKGENVIEFKAILPAELPGNGDPRKLCYSFKSIQIEESE